MHGIASAPGCRCQVLRAGRLLLPEQGCLFSLGHRRSLLRIDAGLRVGRRRPDVHRIASPTRRGRALLCTGAVSLREHRRLLSDVADCHVLRRHEHLLLSRHRSRRSGPPRAVPHSMDLGRSLTGERLCASQDFLRGTGVVRFHGDSEPVPRRAHLGFGTFHR
jgi:hypothetical protein